MVITHIHGVEACVGVENASVEIFLKQVLPPSDIEWFVKAVEND